MEGGMVLETLLKNQRLAFSSDGFDSSWPSNSFHGEKKSVSWQVEREENSNEDYEKCSRQPEKKRRISVDHVQFLEKSFDKENKLHPERKIQLAKQLNLQPRQVAIWFQNRRARSKSKQLQKDYEILNSTYVKLKSEFGSLQKHNDKLKHEVQMLKEKLDKREQGEKDECPSKQLDSSAEPPNSNPFSIQSWINEPNMVICKQEYATKSDIIDSYSPDRNHSSFLDPCDSSNVFENQSDFSQDEDSVNILRCPKIEYESYIDPNEGSLGYPIDYQPFWLWP